MKIAMQKIILISSIFLTLLISCTSNKENNQNKMSNNNSTSNTYANYNHVAIKHIDLDLKVDFENQIIEGFATYTIKKIQQTDTIILDAKKLDIIEVLSADKSKNLTYQLGENNELFGQALIISLIEGETTFHIRYKTQPSADALQWLEASQTANKNTPLLFSQSQAILARTWIPLQDVPAVRFTYNTKVTVPKEMIALMSATNPQAKNSDGVYNFSMTQPIPSYLMAITVGDFEFKAIGERCGVYAEKVLLDIAAYEFEDMESMLLSAEKLYGKYLWDRYDVVVMPPSFPFGGMENPKLTFATPTIIAGDKSLVSLIAHELAHSWSGNLVTNATWDDFWLNEGFTVYLERRIMEEIEGKDYSDILALIGWDDLQNTLKDFEKDIHKTKLKQDLDSKDPDESMNDIAYEKGYAFLIVLEKYFGREIFDKFLLSYFNLHKFKSLTTEDFLDYAKVNLFSSKENSYNDLKIEEWIYETGLPSNAIKPKALLFDEVEQEIARQTNKGELNKELTKNWNTHQWIHFLRNTKALITTDYIKKYDEIYQFTTSRNSEILAIWFEHCVEKNYTDVNNELKNFLTNVGRRKFIVPLYKLLVKGNQTQKEFAINVYKQARKGYHSVAVNTLDEILK